MSVLVCSYLTGLSSALAGPVELRSKDGLLSLTGEIVAVTDTMLNLDTGHGLISVARDEVACFGHDCPVAAVDDTIQDTAWFAFIGDTSDDLLLALPSARDVVARSGLTLDGLQMMDVGNVRQARPAPTRSPHANNARQALFPRGKVGDVPISTESLTHGADMIFDGPRDWARADGMDRHHLAVQGLSILVGPGTGVTTVSLENLAGIFAGDITNWSALGGVDLDIQPLRLPDGSGGYENLMAAVMRPFGKDRALTGLLVGDERQAAQIARVAKGSIAVVTRQAGADADQLALRDSCGRPIAATDFMIKTGQYPLTVAAFAQVEADIDSTLVARLVGAGGSPRVQSDAQFGADGPDGGEQPVTSHRISALQRLDAKTREALHADVAIQTMTKGTQLPMVFRDGPVGAATGAKYLADFEALANAINDGVFDGRSVHFMGFANANADGSSGETGATWNAFSAAQSIFEAFVAFAPKAVAREQVAFKASGHGSAGRSFCAVSDAGEANAVEVWVH